MFTAVLELGLENSTFFQAKNFFLAGTSLNQKPS